MNHPGFRQFEDGTTIHLPIIPVQASTDKLARAEAVAPMIESGMVLFPDPGYVDAPWLAD